MEWVYFVTDEVKEVNHDMPQAVETYLVHNNLQAVDEAKREIIDLYEEDFTKIDGTGLAGR